MAACIQGSVGQAARGSEQASMAATYHQTLIGGGEGGGELLENVKGCGVTADDALGSYPPPSLSCSFSVSVIQSLPGARSGSLPPVLLTLPLPQIVEIWLRCALYAASFATQLKAGRSSLLGVCEYYVREEDREGARKR